MSRPARAGRSPKSLRSPRVRIAARACCLVCWGFLAHRPNLPGAERVSARPSCIGVGPPRPTIAAMRRLTAASACLACLCLGTCRARRQRLPGAAAGRRDRLAAVDPGRRAQPRRPRQRRAAPLRGSELLQLRPDPADSRPTANGAAGRPTRTIRSLLGVLAVLPGGPPARAPRRDRRPQPPIRRALRPPLRRARARLAPERARRRPLLPARGRARAAAVIGRRHRRRPRARPGPALPARGRGLRLRRAQHTGSAAAAARRVAGSSAWSTTTTTCTCASGARADRLSSPVGVAVLVLLVGRLVRVQIPDLLRELLEAAADHLLLQAVADRGQRCARTSSCCRRTR